MLQCRSQREQSLLSMQNIVDLRSLNIHGHIRALGYVYNEGRQSRIGLVKFHSLDQLNRHIGIFFLNVYNWIEGVEKSIACFACFQYKNLRHDHDVILLFKNFEYFAWEQALAGYVWLNAFLIDNTEKCWHAIYPNSHMPCEIIPKENHVGLWILNLGWILNIWEVPCLDSCS